MSPSQRLRAAVSARLAAAAEDIFDLLERTIAEYEEELSQCVCKHKKRREEPDTAAEPHASPDVQMPVVSPGFSLKQEIQEPQIKEIQEPQIKEIQEPQIKEEPEEPCINQEQLSLCIVEEDSLALMCSEPEADAEEDWRTSHTEADEAHNSTVQGHYSLTEAIKLLGLLPGENSELEDLSDVDDPVGDADYQPPRQGPNSSEEDSSGWEDLIPSRPVRGRKRHRDEHEGPPSERDSSSSCTPRRRSRTPKDDADVSNNILEDIKPEPSLEKRVNKGCGVRWRPNPLTSNQSKFEHEDETEQDRVNWSSLDYMQQYIDKSLMKNIADCTNATSLARGGVLLNTTTEEIYHFFGACILMSCIPYPEIRMYWSGTLRLPAITEKFTHDRFFRLRRSLKVVIDEDVPQDIRECDKFWKVRPFLKCILKGCMSQARPQCVSIDEQIIPFTGACPCRQYLPMKPNPVGMKNFVCATADGIVLDFHIYEGVDALLAEVEEPEDLGLGGLVLKRLTQTLHPNTNVYCDQFFTSIQSVERMMKKQIYITGRVMKNRITTALQNLPNDKTMKTNGRGTSAQVTTEDGRVCVVKWFDNKPVLMMSAVHEKEPDAQDTCQRWDKKRKRHVTIPRPYIVQEYNSKMDGVDLMDRMMSYYPMSGRTKKWTLRMLMHFTDLALANSWLLYRKDHTVRGTEKKNIQQFLEFRMDVAITFLSQLDSDNPELSQTDDDEDDVVQGKRRSVKAVPHVSVRRSGNAHMPEVVHMKNAARCRAKSCSGKTRVRCTTCRVFLCLQGDRNCYTAFHT